mmetsp:Transcript_35289/g.104390  ORF Transcript_35289/g.104390 Transcript_35289/m.104390 type:complete len:247 (+) Transcript_35289:483-1223(+)
MRGLQALRSLRVPARLQPLSWCAGAAVPVGDIRSRPTRRWRPPRRALSAGPRRSRWFGMLLLDMRPATPHKSAATSSARTPCSSWATSAAAAATAAATAMSAPAELCLMTCRRRLWPACCRHTAASTAPSQRSSGQTARARRAGTLCSWQQAWCLQIRQAGSLAPTSILSRWPAAGSSLSKRRGRGVRCPDPRPQLRCASSFPTVSCAGLSCRSASRYSRCCSNRRCAWPYCRAHAQLSRIMLAAL